MQPALFRRSGWLLLGAWLVGFAANSRADAPASAPPLVPPADAKVNPDATNPALDPVPAAAGRTPAAPDEALRRALDLERQRQWSAAIEVYEKALERWPERVDLRHRLRLCESHHKLARRYQDQSFRAILLRLPRDQVLALYDEILDRIETHYVEPVRIEPLLRRGLDNLEVALRDPVFLRTNAPNADPGRVRWLREAYRERRNNLGAADRDGARALVLEAIEQGRGALQLPPAAVVFEFAFGACDMLDEYTICLTKDKLDDLYAVIDGNFVGLGIELKLDAKTLKLVGVIPGGPASEAGLHVGDQITRIDGQDVGGLGLDEAAGRLQGEEGTTVEIVVARPDGTSRPLRLTRRPIEVQSVALARIADPAQGVGYVQLNGFQKSSTEELRRAITGLQRQGLRSLVIDLRGNPGGLLNVAVDIADLFLEQGVIVSTRGRASNQSATYSAHPGSAYRLPLAVLIDHDSASASEILAGALKDHRRALIVGERSYGKGSVQSIFPLKSAPAGLKLTTAKFYSPQNRPYSERGVEPDVTVHVVARPAATSDTPDTEYGDPARDPVLRRAIDGLKRSYAKAG